MKSYYVNKISQSNGDHEVHAEGCHKLPLLENRIYLGYFASCQPAVTDAKKYYRQVNGCVHCSTACHTK